MSFSDSGDEDPIAYQLEELSIQQQQSTVSSRYEIPEVPNKDKLDFRMGSQPPDEMLVNESSIRRGTHRGRYQSANTGVSFICTPYFSLSSLLAHCYLC